MNIVEYLKNFQLPIFNEVTDAEFKSHMKSLCFFAENDQEIDQILAQSKEDNQRDMNEMQVVRFVDAIISKIAEETGIDYHQI